MIWPFGQTIIVMDLRRFFGGAGMSCIDATARVRRDPLFRLAMEYASQLIFGRRKNALGLFRQHVLRAFTTKEAVDRCKPVSEAPTVLSLAEEIQNTG